MSKGHAGPALYATLSLKGFFPKEMLSELNQGGGRLPSHCDRNKTPGVDMTTGSLGQGISAAIGMALGCRMNKSDSITYLIIGDGECNEGQIWEGAMFAAAHKLDNSLPLSITTNSSLTVLQKIFWIWAISAINSGASAGLSRTVNGHDTGEILDAVIAARHIKGARPSLYSIRSKATGRLPPALKATTI